jgi:hypothetical protein
VTVKVRGPAKRLLVRFHTSTCRGRLLSNTDRFADLFRFVAIWHVGTIALPRTLTPVLWRSCVVSCYVRFAKPIVLEDGVTCEWQLPISAKPFPNPSRHAGSSDGG